jgi:hypothetical protein
MFHQMGDHATSRLQVAGCLALLFAWHGMNMPIVAFAGRV